jgi:hypothetical protein
LGRGKDFAVVSALGPAPLVLEILGEERRESSAILARRSTRPWGIDRQTYI